jgi:hypothetical protein
MKSLVDLSKEVSAVEQDINTKKERLREILLEKRNLFLSVEELERQLYLKKISLAHVKEIFRLAKIQFSRLHRNKDLNTTEPTLTDADVRELNKWISRVKGEDGLIDIIKAITELDKYSPSDIKVNLYALVQKIIIEGPYKKQRK